MAPRPDKYINLDLTLIKYIETFTMYTSGVMKRIRDNANILGIIQVTRPLGLRL